MTDRPPSFPSRFGRACVRFFWARRYRVYDFVHRVGAFFLRLYRRLPIPPAARRAIKDVFFTACERFIIRNSVYQSWLEQRSGLQQLTTSFAAADETEYERMPPAPAPTEQAWEVLIAERAAKLAPGEPRIDVIVPVYKGYAETLICLYSVLTAPVAAPYELVVINDASPDPTLSAKLRLLSQRGLFTLIENETNRGFVATVNRGMALHETRDVLLLNSDTQVYGDWLDRLLRTAYSAARVATVTPLSNNAEIASYPQFVRDNDMVLELGYAALDRLAAGVNAGSRVEIPTAVGFCMLIRRDALRVLGYFDEAAFGRGYGEENDFSLRATAAGWTHLLAGDCFVRHAGGASFGRSKDRRMARALKTLHRRFPKYRETVQAFIAADPPRSLRRRLDLARIDALPRRGAVLFVSHNWGGGTERHVHDMMLALHHEGIMPYVLRPHPIFPTHVVLACPLVPFTPNLHYDIHSEAGELEYALRALGIARLHIHHLVGFDRAAADFFPMLAARLGIPYDFTVHDYFSFCPRINLIGPSGVYCGEPEIATCESCVRSQPSHAGTMPVWQWRLQYGRLLEGAANVYAPSQDAAQRILRYFPQAKLRVQPHFETTALRLTPTAAVPQDGTRHIAVIGAVGPHKGSEILLACAIDAAKRGLPLHFHIFGSTNNAHLLSRYDTHVTVHGAYREGDIYTLLAQQHCQVAFAPSVCPETYSYTLSIALQAGLFPVAFDIGALAERIRAGGWGAVLPREWMTEAGVINDALLDLHITSRPEALRVPLQRDLYPNIERDYYHGGLTTA